MTKIKPLLVFLIVVICSHKVVYAQCSQLLKDTLFEYSKEKGFYVSSKSGEKASNLKVLQHENHNGFTVKTSKDTTCILKSKKPVPPMVCPGEAWRVVHDSNWDPQNDPDHTYSAFSVIGEKATVDPHVYLEGSSICKESGVVGNVYLSSTQIFGSAKIIGEPISSEHDLGVYLESVKVYGNATIRGSYIALMNLSIQDQPQILGRFYMSFTDIFGNGYYYSDLSLAKGDPFDYTHVFSNYGNSVFYGDNNIINAAGIFAAHLFNVTMIGDYRGYPRINGRGQITQIAPFTTFEGGVLVDNTNVGMGITLTGISSDLYFPGLSFLNTNIYNDSTYSDTITSVKGEGSITDSDIRNSTLEFLPGTDVRNMGIYEKTITASVKRNWESSDYRYDIDQDYINVSVECGFSTNPDDPYCTSNPIFQSKKPKTIVGLLKSSSENPTSDRKNPLTDRKIKKILQYHKSKSVRF